MQSFGNLRQKLQKLFSAKLITILIPPIAVVLAIFVGGIVVYALGVDPVFAFKQMLIGAFGTLYAVGESCVKMTPLIFTGLSFAIARRCGLLNIGAEGQLYIGGLCAGLVGIYLQGLPAIIHLPVAVLAGFIGGGLFGMLAGALKVKFGANEIITTIMLNYVANYFINFMVTGPIIEPPGKYKQSPPILSSAQMFRPFSGSRVHIGLFIALACIVFFYLFLWKTTKGYETRVVGYNQEAALYAGINPSHNIMLTMFISGAFAGLAGATEILATQLRIFQNFSPNIGFDGIAVAMLGQNNPLGILLSASLFGAMKSGSNLMSMNAGVPNSVITIIQGLVIVFVIGSNVFTIIRKRRTIIRQYAIESDGCAAVISESED